MGWLGFGFGGIFMILFWILIVWVVIALLRGGSGRGFLCGHNHDEHKLTNGNSALNILKERYAKGEINKQEFDEKKKDLT